jgi:hypothetical protein
MYPDYEELRRVVVDGINRGLVILPTLESIKEKDKKLRSLVTYGTRDCVYCGKDFVRKSSGSLRCEDCKNVKTKCFICSKAFTPRKSKVVTCSKECGIAKMSATKKRSLRPIRKRKRKPIRRRYD